MNRNKKKKKRNKDVQELRKCELYTDLKTIRDIERKTEKERERRTKKRKERDKVVECTYI